CPVDGPDGLAGSALTGRNATGLADEGHPLALDGVEAHPQRGGLLLGDLTDVPGLLLGRHRPAADDRLGFADHQPREVVAIHAAPRRREEVVGPLEPDLERRERWRGLQPLAFLHQLPRADDQLVTGHRVPSGSPASPASAAPPASPVASPAAIIA